MSNYSSTTRDISVSVEPIYLSDQSAPEDDYYVWAYKVEIENKGKETVQIRSRFWRITDSFGRTQETRGMGVVGEQPVIKPGEKFEYTSGTPLQAPSGMMAIIRCRRRAVICSKSKFRCFLWIARTTSSGCTDLTYHCLNPGLLTLWP
jgi:ApaG protein